MLGYSLLYDRAPQKRFFSKGFLSFGGSLFLFTRCILNKNFCIFLFLGVDVRLQISIFSWMLNIKVWMLKCLYVFRGNKLGYFKSLNNLIGGFIWL